MYALPGGAGTIDVADPVTRKQAFIVMREEQDKAGRSRRDLDLKLSHHRRIAEQEAAMRKVLKNQRVERIRPR